MGIKYPRKYAPKYKNINASQYSSHRITVDYHKQFGLDRLKAIDASNKKQAMTPRNNTRQDK